MDDTVAVVPAQQTFPFRRLPPELRNKIYEELFSSDFSIGAFSTRDYSKAEAVHLVPQRVFWFIKHEFSRIDECDPETYQKLNLRLFLNHARWYSNAELLLTCRQIRTEAFLMFFHCHDFTFTDAYTLNHFVLGIGPDARKSITKLKLYCFGKNMRSCRPGDECNHDGLVVDHYQTEPNLVYALRLLRDCTGLKQLDIRICLQKMKIELEPWTSMSAVLFALTNALEVVLSERPPVPEYQYMTCEDTVATWLWLKGPAAEYGRKQFRHCLRLSRDKDLEFKIINGSFIPFVKGSQVIISGLNAYRGPTSKMVQRLWFEDLEHLGQVIAAIPLPVPMPSWADWIRQRLNR
ncbi:MAG: hypothetical protein M1812_001424 [Candelaria pacifica]|nr:MAG: hypothetical protein M1812_001424 [Candelaria pacifica]